VKAAPGIHRVQWTLVTPMLTPPGGRGGRGGGGGGAAPAAGADPAPLGGGRGAAPNVSCSAVIGGRGGGGAAVAGPGSYIAKLTVGGKEYVKPVTVLEDRWMNER
jgi:hypothetical protein